MFNTRVCWRDSAPPDHEDWESIIQARLRDVVGVCDVTLQSLGDGRWTVRHAECHAPGVGSVEPGGPLPQPSTLEMTAHLTIALARAGKAIVGGVGLAQPCGFCGQELRLRADGRTPALVLCMNVACPESRTGGRLLVSTGGT